LRDEEWRQDMSLRSKRLAQSQAATQVARLALDKSDEAIERRMIA